MTNHGEPPTDQPLPVWEQRYRSTRISLPEWAHDRPSHCLYVSNPTGTFELFTWDRDTDTHRQATQRANGTVTGTLSPDGNCVWWFDDTDGDEFGIWRRQSFHTCAQEGPPAEVALPEVAPSYPAGLELGPDGLVVVGRSTDNEGTTLLSARVGALGQPWQREPVSFYQTPDFAAVSDLSEDGTLIAYAHSEQGDQRHPALRVVRLSADGSVTTIGQLWDGPGKGVNSLGFAPHAGDMRLLVEHERRGRDELLLWDLATGEQRELPLELPGQIGAQWFPDATALLVDHSHEGRSQLYRYELATSTLTAIPTPSGTVLEATARPDGSVEYTWTDSATPKRLISTAGVALPKPAGAAMPGSVPVMDAWVPGPGGNVHALISRPLDAQGQPHLGPLPTVFSIHGGPTWHDCDAMDVETAAWVDQGYVVVRVNYRGSTGYGTAWRDGNEGRPGLTEIEDIAAVRQWCVDHDLTDPQRVAITGGSWGGYLTLLALGVQPDLWSLGVANVPVADYVSAYAEEMESLKEFDNALFGGSPQQFPDLYRQCSPLTYASALIAPVLILAGDNDPRCPIRQIENYVQALEQRGHPVQFYRYDAGHGSLVNEEAVKQQRMAMQFVATYWSQSSLDNHGTLPPCLH